MRITATLLSNFCGDCINSKLDYDDDSSRKIYFMAPKYNATMLLTHSFLFIGN